MRKKLYFLLCMLVVVALAVVIPVLLDNSFLEIGANMAIYLTAKIVFGMWLIAAIVLVLVKDLANTTGTIFVGVALFAQVVPLAVRFLLPVSGGMIWSIVIMGITLIACLVLTGMLMFSNKKMVESDKKYEGKTIAVKDDSEMYDENNHFKGVK